jgi:small subunit ribosomal protein S7
MDPVYGSDLVTKFVNSLMYQGKKSTAEGIFYKALTQLEQKGGGTDAITLFKKAVENAKPLLEVKSRRVGGANYQVPVEVNADRRTSLAIRWLITYSRDRAEKGMVDKLAMNYWTRPMARAPRSKRKKMYTVWRKPTKPSRITGGKRT